MRKNKEKKDNKTKKENRNKKDKKGHYTEEDFKIEIYSSLFYTSKDGIPQFLVGYQGVNNKFLDAILLDLFSKRNVAIKPGTSDQRDPDPNKAYAPDLGGPDKKYHAFIKMITKLNEKKDFPPNKYIVTTLYGSLICPTCGMGIELFKLKNAATKNTIRPLAMTAQNDHNFRPSKNLGGALGNIFMANSLYISMYGELSKQFIPKIKNLLSKGEYPTVFKNLNRELQLKNKGDQILPVLKLMGLPIEPEQLCNAFVFNPEPNLI